MEGDGNRVEKKGAGYFEGKLPKCFLSHFLRAVKLLSLAGRRKHRQKRPEMQDFTGSEKSPSLFGHCLDVGMLVPYVESRGINDTRDRI